MNKEIHLTPFPPIRERDQEINYLNMMVNSIGIPLSYIQSDLLMRGIVKLTSLKGEFSVMDASKIRAQWEEHWEAEVVKANKDTKE